MPQQVPHFGGSGWRAVGCMEENRDKGAQEEDSRGQRKGQVQVLGCWPNVWRKKDASHREPLQEDWKMCGGWGDELGFE